MNVTITSSENYPQDQTYTNILLLMSPLSNFASLAVCDDVNKYFRTDYDIYRRYGCVFANDDNEFGGETSETGFFRITHTSSYLFVQNWFLIYLGQTDPSSFVFTIEQQEIGRDGLDYINTLSVPYQITI